MTGHVTGVESGVLMRSPAVDPDAPRAVGAGGSRGMLIWSDATWRTGAPGCRRLVCQLYQPLASWIRDGPDQWIRRIRGKPVDPLQIGMELDQLVSILQLHACVEQQALVHSRGRWCAAASKTELHFSSSDDIITF